jgi:hypothetical protein
VAESLALLQRRLLALIAQPHPMRESAIALRSRDPGAYPMRRWISARDELEAEERLGVYARAYYARLRDSLRQGFPCVSRILGNAVFEAVVVDYLREHPSRQPSLHSFGRAMPSFLRIHPRTRNRSDLADLALLEWARVESFAEADAPLLTEELLAALPAAAWPQLRLCTTPSCRLLELEYRVDAAWSAADRGLVAPPAELERTPLVVWRRDLVVRHRVLSTEEARAFCRLALGATFAEVCEAFADEDCDLEGAAVRALYALRQWIMDQVLRRP